MVARGEGGWEGWLKMVKGLRSPDWQLQNSCVDLKYTIENIVNNNVISMYGARWVLEILGGDAL